MVDKSVVLITRTWCDKKIKDFIKNIYKELSRIIVLINIDEEKKCPIKTEKELKSCNNAIRRILEIVPVKPWGKASGALNIGLKKAFDYKPDYILIASSEVNLQKSHVNIISDILSKRKKMLVVGYALRTKLDNLEDWERGHSFNKNCSDTLRVPWNTCAMWNANLFLENVGAFNIICDCSKYLGEKEGIPLRGMEDFLAIALAKRTNPILEIGLIKDHLTWIVDKDRKQKHKRKMKRKCLIYDRYKEIFGYFPTLKIKYL